jgi:hypothetical protein
VRALSSPLVGAFTLANYEFLFAKPTMDMSTIEGFQSMNLTWDERMVLLSQRRSVKHLWRNAWNISYHATPSTVELFMIVWGGLGVWTLTWELWMLVATFSSSSSQRHPKEIGFLIMAFGHSRMTYYYCYAGRKVCMPRMLYSPKYTFRCNW